MLGRLLTTRQLLAVIPVLLIPAAARAAGDPIMPLSQVTPGMHCTALSVVQGTTISSFNADVIDVVDGDASEGSRILIRASGPAVDATGIGEGFSGSPVYCPDGSGTMRNVGAISETVGDYGNKQVLVTPIEQILAGSTTPPIGHRVAGAHPLPDPISITGLPRQVAAAVQMAARRTGRPLITAPGGSAAAGRFAPAPLVPGAAVSAGYSSGDIASGAIGTVSYRDGSTIWAFGHPLDDAGRRSLFLQDAYVYSVINNPVGISDAVTYKLSAPGHDLGTVTADGDSAIAGTIGPLPPHTTLTVDALDADTGRTETTKVQIADETDVGLPTGSSPLTFVGPLAVATAATDIYDGAPALESGRMCMSIKLVEYRKPFGFCNRYVSNTAISSDEPPPLAELAANDASSAFSIFDAVTFARLHVQSVDVTLRAQRGLIDGFMISAKAPRHVRPGQRIPLAVRVRRYRGRIATERFKVRLPADLPHGTQHLELIGTAPEDASAGDLGTILIDVLGGGGDETAGDPGPRNLRDVIDAVQGTARNDGVRVAYPDLHPPARRGRPRAPVFVDPKLRISGTAVATLHVR
jgi:hypothetical protein